ncbi:DUF5011 domain-containing protein [[Clostridium] innocuum]|nr:DUF5011 domain-containing protein [[Clostridium] innocuum]
MENAVRISTPIWITLLIVAVVFSVFGGWQFSAKAYMEKESGQMENTQLHINQNLLEHSFPQIIAQNQRIQQGMSFDIKTHVRAIDHQDGDISEKLEFYGSVNTQEKGVYTIRCVVRNSLGMKSVKHIQILVD